jgi:hypothetical protein
MKLVGYLHMQQAPAQRPQTVARVGVLSQPLFFHAVDCSAVAAVAAPACMPRPYASLEASREFCWLTMLRPSVCGSTEL